ncbi:proteasome component M29, partial [Oleoguttula sp. CCFEE 5521]
KAGPRDLLIESDQTGLDLLRWLLNSLAQDTSGSATTVSIEESLSTLITAIAQFDLAPHEREVLEELLVEQMTLSADLEANKRLRSTRYVTVRFANRCLPFDSVKARWIDVLGIGARDDRAEVREEAERGLNPYWYQMLRGTSASGAKPISFAAFDDVVRQFFGGRTIDSDVEPMAVAVEARKAHKHCFVHMVAFARRVLFHEALKEADMSPGLDNDWDRRIDAAAETDPKARSALKAYVHGVHHKSPQSLAVLQSALFESLTADPSAGQVRLIEFLSLVPDASIARLTPYVGGLLPVILSNHHTPRLTAAQAFGIVATHEEVSKSDVRSSTEDMSLRINSWKTAAGALVNQIHGAIVALGYFHSRSHYRRRSAGDAKAFTQTLLEILEGSKDVLLREATFIALGQL